MLSNLRPYIIHHTGERRDKSRLYMLHRYPLKIKQYTYHKFHIFAAPAKQVIFKTSKPNTTMVIALRGVKDSGKSHTINIVYSLLLHHGFIQEVGHFKELGNYKKFEDFSDILVRDKIRVGIVGIGDYWKEEDTLYLKKLIEDLLKAPNSCDIVVCACRNSSHFNNIITSFNPHVFVDKTTTSKLNEHRIVNVIDADSIIGHINIFIANKAKARFI